MAATELARPLGISDASWGRLQELNATDPATARTIAARAGAATNPDAYVAGAVDARFRNLTASGSGLNAARFGSVAQVLPLTPRHDPSAMAFVRDLHSSSARTEDRARDVDFRLIGGLMGENKVG